MNTPPFNSSRLCAFPHTYTHPPLPAICRPWEGSAYVAYVAARHNAPPNEGPNAAESLDALKWLALLGLSLPVGADEDGTAARRRSRWYPVSIVGMVAFALALFQAAYRYEAQPCMVDARGPKSGVSINTGT